MESVNYIFVMMKIREELRSVISEINEYKSFLFDDGKTIKFLSFEERLDLERLEAKIEVLQMLLDTLSNEHDANFPEENPFALNENEEG